MDEFKRVLETAVLWEYSEQKHYIDVKRNFSRLAAATNKWPTGHLSGLFEQSLRVAVQTKCLSYRPALFPFAPE
jgi:hypothetical protein